MNKTLIQVGAGLAATTLSALAGGGSFGDSSAAGASGLSLPSLPGFNGGDFCENLEDLGKVYKDKNNPFIQEIKFFGRAHFQWGYTDGDSNGVDFSGNGEELRRFRVGTSIKFLNHFKAGARVNLEKGGFRNTDFGYDNFDELYLEFDAGDLGVFENVSVGYGRFKQSFGGEEHFSSKKIKTIERSNINNLFAPRRATGAVIGTKVAGVDYTARIFSTDRNSETFGSWNGGNRSGIGYILSAEFEAMGGDVIVDGMFFDGAVGNDVSRRTDWAGSLTYMTELGNVDLFTNVTYGNQNGEDTYGVVFMPSTYLVEDRLEAVVRYQYANSTGDAISINSRNVRNVAGADGVGIAAGDLNHTIYAGLNYYLCGNNAKVMVGAEYETLSGSSAGTNEDLEATTFWGAFRMYF